MSVKKTVNESNKAIRISIDERFDFSLHQEFRDAYSGEEVQGATFELDLSNTSYMDSSALGMILLLKDHAEKFGGSVIIQRPNEAVNKILEIAQFHRLLTIEA